MRCVISQSLTQSKVLIAKLPPSKVGRSKANGVLKKRCVRPKQYQRSPNDHSVGVIECSFPPRLSRNRRRKNLTKALRSKFNFRTAFETGTLQDSFPRATQRASRNSIRQP
ncbi:hypothetical protein CDAR_268291 [Caerostris darwini]|uniref:Uncharacterized protein n=1 Tax=Caerostris darwini TaxID=1538125 RepID=A0AAV4QLQ8_9ARAC|nr:hypothetical protein CDAR_534881 [Caerostris darwini]GIY47887.1 hypothetical protein CDAR_268291 [Caerostris darwini]